MTDTLIIGTIGLDTIETPFGKVEEVLGGSGTYASFAASFFSKPALVSIVGTDFPKHHEAMLIMRGINLSGLQRTGKTFRWEGMYEFDMNEAKTLKTELNSLLDFKPSLPEEFKDIPYLFLANVDPDIQLAILQQMKSRKFTVLDTMNYWISSKKEKLLEVIKNVDLLLLNDGEARQLFGTVNLVHAAKQALALGPQYVIIKKGEHGALLFSDGKHFNAPGYPLEVIKDPTGCGDTFGGSLIGHIARTKDTSENNIRKAIIYGSAIASFNAEGFSLQRLSSLTPEELERRFHEFRTIREF
ncbi:MAG TPA: PfkB family carbohydrate kinase [Candidatus Nanoarchaeia archaeon]|nr:PfkB family carbohydrate kinase [Candidatus Nanoarchaeia archaeon]